MEDASLQVVSLTPLPDNELRVWIEKVMITEGLQFDSEGYAIALFLSYVQGHLGDAIALARRIWLDCRISSCSEASQKPGSIQAHHVHRSALALMEDLAITFESLILLLPQRKLRY